MYDPVLWIDIVLVALLLGCAFSDLRARIIPNVLVLALALLGLVEAWATQRNDLVRGLLMACLLFIGLMPLQQKGVLGGGDVKLIAALAVWLAPLDVGRFLILTLAAGGVVGLAFLFIGWARKQLRLNASSAMTVPYALAIVGGFVALRADRLAHLVVR